jgi:hypothetical protein
MSDNVGAASLFLSLSRPDFCGTVLIHITPAGHQGLHNINAEPKTRKGLNLVWLSPMIWVAWSSSDVSFPAGDKYCEFLCFNFQHFDRLKCVTKYTSVIFYIVSDPQCVNTCHLLSQTQVVVPVFMVATFAKYFLMGMFLYKKHVSEYKWSKLVFSKCQDPWQLKHVA